MANPVKDQKVSVSPGFQFEAITPNDSNDLAIAARSLYIGTGGNIAVHNSDGDTVLFTNVADGTFLPINTLRVLSTNTTASNIIAIY